MEALILDMTESAAARALSLALPVHSWLQLGRQMEQILGTCRGGGLVPPVDSGARRMAA